MNNMLKNAFRISIITGTIVTGWCLAEDFLVPAEPVSVDRKRVSGSALKQEIGELCGQLIHQSSKQIELLAQAQQELYNRVAELMGSDKKAYLNRASRAELQKSLEELKKIKQNLKLEYEKLYKQIQFFRRGCNAS